MVVKMLKHFFSGLLLAFLAFLAFLALLALPVLASPGGGLFKGIIRNPEVFEGIGFWDIVWFLFLGAGWKGVNDDEKAGCGSYAVMLVITLVAFYYW
jgi:hypothetical protein